MKYIFLSIISILAIVSVVITAQASAQGPFDSVCKTTPQASVCKEAGSTQKKTTNPLYGPDSITSKATSLIALIVGVASVIMIIIGGIKFTISGGDSAGVNSAKNTVLYAVIGLAIAAAAQSIVVFVINRL